MTKPECPKNENDYIKMLEDRHKILDDHIEKLLEEIHMLKSAIQQVELIESEKLEELRRSECVLRWLTQSDLQRKEVQMNHPPLKVDLFGDQYHYLDQTR